VAVRDDRSDMPIGQVDSEVIEGNHVVVELAPERYLLLAHLQQGSVVVAEGDEVGAGDLLGRCGNSGNTSQPHLHIQVQSRPTFSNADPELRTFGIRWERLRRNGVERAEVAARRNDELLPP
jgi:murein DD-endopeptidase MepM/ murein hydrolase activator NlpD